jgi:hypothetical protein
VRSSYSYGASIILEQTSEPVETSNSMAAFLGVSRTRSRQVTTLNTPQPARTEVFYKFYKHALFSMMMRVALGEPNSKRAKNWTPKVYRFQELRFRKRARNPLSC